MELYPMWGYAGIQAISGGVITPSGSDHIILFVTRQKASGFTPYQDFLSGDRLHWEGQKGHRSDRRIARAAERGHEIHLFYRDIHHTPFRYHGPIRLLHFTERKDAPSHFQFQLVHDLSSVDDIETHSSEFMTLSVTEREAVVHARVGQGTFREELRQYWGGCAITGIEHAELLRASHIKPWRSSTNYERLNPHNGLLLLPQYDHLFDRGYITFDERGKIERSPAIKTLPSDRLGIDLGAKLRRISPEHMPYLEYHQSEVFQRFIRAD